MSDSVGFKLSVDMRLELLIGPAIRVSVPPVEIIKILDTTRFIPLISST